MIRSKKIFTGGANQDDSLHLLEDSQYLRIMNGRVGVTQYGRNARVENVPGTTPIAQSVYPPYGTNICIGSCVDVEGQRLIWFICNTFGDHGIYAYDFASNITYAVLYDSQVYGGLNFNKNHRIDRNCKVSQGLLYWTDNYNEPKKINIDSGIKLNNPSYQTDAIAYNTLEDSYEITLIRRPPVFAPSITKNTDGAFVNNFIGNKSWQFAWQYIYFDNEESVLSEYSKASKMNFSGNNTTSAETYNYITCELPLTEAIPQTARIIRLIAKDQLNNIASVVKTWDKLVDAAPFINHNSGAQALTFDFYGNIIGETITSFVTSKPFDSVPLLTKTIETATNRLYLGNNLSGYDTPTSTSLGIELTQNTAPPTGNVFKIDVSSSSTSAFDCQSGGGFGTQIVMQYSAYSMSGPVAPDVEIVYVLSYDGVNGFPVTIPANSGFSFLFSTDSFTGCPTGNSVVDVASITVNGVPFVLGINGWQAQASTSGIQQYFKKQSSYQFGTVFYDKARRKCGVVSNNELIVNTPLKSYNDSTAFVTSWSLSNANAVNEIPDWAYYYSVVRTLNLKTRYFIDSFSGSNKYYKLDQSTGTYTYQDNWDSSVTGLAIETDALLQAKMGYNYTEGDMCLLIPSSPIGSAVRFELPVVGQDGKYILLKPKNLGSLVSVQFTYEIYTPYIKSETEPFFEVGNIYQVANAGLSNRTYSITSGILDGDIFNFQLNYGVTSYYVESMNNNLDFYKYWFTDAGFANFVTLLGQNRNEHEIRYSNVYTPGTQNNGLSTFEVLNFKTVPLGTGSIQKLQLASKTTEQGVIMLSIGVSQTASCYLGEVQLVGSAQNAFIAQDPSVIGTINVLKGMYGTTSPETVVEYLGNIFWYDLNNGQVIQYSSNGLFPISSFKMERLFKNYAKGYLVANSNNLDNINGFHHLPTFIDPFHKEFGVSLVGLTYENYASTLPSYASVPSYASSIINRFDISDNLAKTVVFNLVENKWISDYQFMGEQYDYFENRFFGFKNGAPYEFNTNTSTWNTWFGTQYPVRVCWVVNKPLSGLKDMSEIVMETSVAPDFTVVYTTLPNTQITDLTSSDYVSQEGILYGRLLRDRLSPNATGTPDQKLMTGDIVISQIPQIMAEFQQYSSIIYINFVDVGFNLSRGQNFILAE